ncbi:conserved hypothetical protein [Altererythrobacter sp. B11]|uniref:PepSY domain-containing protein n=1 Tax=Altererythrobacter sp. B11 TaxID=2060312 RepID=UPI000DC6FF00|nr:PepSY domain-containing protein [Altererythrobacter sp. B11]BBC73663.1 conserved hypothetical protein [Altererythrobacter sp. B11]
MTKFIALFLSAALAVSGAPASAQSQTRGDQERAREEMKAGRNMRQEDIVRRIMPQMKGYKYLTSEYDGVTDVYRLKFIKGVQVTYVDVDARTGKILRITE